MRFPKLKLHNKILLALVLGALFGSLFNISKHKLEITYLDGQSEKVKEVVENWSRIDIVDIETNEVRASFGSEDQLRVLPFFNKIPKAERKKIAILVSYEAASPRRFEGVLVVEKVKTIATLIKPIGTIFIRLLMFVAIPLVLSSLIVGTASLGDIKKVGRIGFKTLSFYLVTIILAIALGLTLVNFIQPGTRLGDESRVRTRDEELALLKEVGQAMRDASICGLGQTASSAIESALNRPGLVAL